MVNVFTKSISMRLALSLLIILISINVSAESISTSRLNRHSSNSVYSLSSLNMDKPIIDNAQNFSKEKNDKKKKQDVDVEKDDAVLVVLGEGSTKDEATKVALRSAIEQAFGTFVSSNTAILNDNLVKDDIITVSSGNVKSFRYISEIQKDGKWYVTLQAIVSIGKLTSYVQQKGGETELAGATFAMDIKMKKLYKQNEEVVLKHLMEELKVIVPQMFDYSIEASSPRASDNEYCSDLKVTIRTNNNYTAARNLIWNTLGVLCLKGEEDIVDMSQKGLNPTRVKFYAFGKENQRSVPILATQLPVTYLNSGNSYDNDQYVVFRSKQFFEDFGKLIRTTLGSFTIDVGFDKLFCTIDEFGYYRSSEWGIRNKCRCSFKTKRGEYYLYDMPSRPYTDDIAIGCAATGGNSFFFPVAESAKWTLNGTIYFTLEQVERINNIKVYSMQQMKSAANAIDITELSRNFETAVSLYGQLLKEKPTMTLDMLDGILKDGSQKEKFLQELPISSREQFGELLRSYKSLKELPTFSKAMFEEVLKAYMQEKR